MTGSVSLVYYMYLKVVKTGFKHSCITFIFKYVWKTLGSYVYDGSLTFNFHALKIYVRVNRLG